MYCVGAMIVGGYLRKQGNRDREREKERENQGEQKKKSPQAKVY